MVYPVDSTIKLYTLYAIEKFLNVIKNEFSHWREIFVSRNK